MTNRNAEDLQPFLGKWQPRIPSPHQSARFNCSRSSGQLRHPVRLHTSSVPHLRLSVMQMDLGVGQELLYHNKMRIRQTFWYAHCVDVIKESHDVFTTTQPLLRRFRRSVLSQCEECWHEGGRLAPLSPLVEYESILKRPSGIAFREIRSSVPTRFRIKICQLVVRRTRELWPLQPVSRLASRLSEPPISGGCFRRRPPSPPPLLPPPSPHLTCSKLSSAPAYGLQDFTEPAPLPETTSLSDNWREVVRRHARRTCCCTPALSPWSNRMVKPRPATNDRVLDRVILACTCVKPLVRLYVCQRVGPFLDRF